MQVATLKDYTDLMFDWSQVTVDFFGKAVNPVDRHQHRARSPSGTCRRRRSSRRSRSTACRRCWRRTSASSPPSRTALSHSMDLLGFNELGNPLPTEDLWARFNTADADCTMYPQDQYTFLADGAERGRTWARTRACISPSSTSIRTPLQTELDLHERLHEALAIRSIRRARTRWWSRPLRPGADDRLGPDERPTALGNSLRRAARSPSAAVAHYSKTETLARAAAAVPQPGGDRRRLVVRHTVVAGRQRRSAAG